MNLKTSLVTLAAAACLASCHVTPAVPTGDVVLSQRVIRDLQQSGRELDLLVPTPMRPRAWVGSVFTYVTKSFEDAPGGSCVGEQVGPFIVALLRAADTIPDLQGTAVDDVPLPAGCPQLSSIEAFVVSRYAAGLEDLWLHEQAIPWRARACTLRGELTCHTMPFGGMPLVSLPAGLPERTMTPAAAWWVVRVEPRALSLAGEPVLVASEESMEWFGVLLTLQFDLERALESELGTSGGAVLVAVDARAPRDYAVRAIRMVRSVSSRVWVAGQTEGRPVRVDADALLAVWDAEGGSPDAPTPLVPRPVISGLVGDLALGTAAQARGASSGSVLP